MNVAYIGNSPLAEAVIRRLVAQHRVDVFNPGRMGGMGTTIARAATNLSKVSIRPDVLITCLRSPAEVREVLLGPEGFAQGLSARRIVIDQTPGDPDQTRAIADKLREKGIVLVDAPIHCEQVEAFPETAAIMCGGAVDTVESVRPILECICPKVVYCGDTGNGHAAQLVTSAVAACNRLITYECTAVGLKNGLAIEHMAVVLNKSSGFNSASERVLPVLATAPRTTDVPLAAVIEELKMASRLGMKSGAPMLIANLARFIIESAAARIGATATLDDLAPMFEVAAVVNPIEGH